MLLLSDSTINCIKTYFNNPLVTNVTYTEKVLNQLELHICLQTKQETTTPRPSTCSQIIFSNQIYKMLLYGLNNNEGRAVAVTTC